MSAGAAIVMMKPRIAVLEDSLPLAKDLLDTLNSTGRLECVPAANWVQFADAVEQEDIDAASIDWRVGDFNVGGQALKHVCRHATDAGRLVYTFYDYEQEAKQNQTDFFLRKQTDGVLLRYLDKAWAAVRLGLARKTQRVLAALGRGFGVSPFTPGSFDSCTEDQLYASARDVLLERVLSGSPDHALRTILVRAGRWRMLNRGAYIDMPWRQKIGELSTFTSLTPDNLCKILGCRSNLETEAFFTRFQLPSVPTPELDQRADALLSIFSYVLQMASQEPEAMRHYWTAEGLYSEATRESRPPWDAHGLEVYLVENGPEGLEQAACWIRSH